MFKKIYSMSKVGRLSTSTPLVKIHFFNTSVTAFVISDSFFDSKARIRIFSSLTRNGLYLIFLLDEGNFNSYVGVSIVGKGMI